jgi:hypothetical protein
VLFAPNDITRKVSATTVAPACAGAMRPTVRRPVRGYLQDGASRSLFQLRSSPFSAPVNHMKLGGHLLIPLNASSVHISTDTAFSHGHRSSSTVSIISNNRQAMKTIREWTHGKTAALNDCFLLSSGFSVSDSESDLSLRRRSVICQRCQHSGNFSN